MDSQVTFVAVSAIRVLSRLLRLQQYSSEHRSRRLVIHDAIMGWSINTTQRRSPTATRSRDTYVDNIDLPEMLYAAALRSPYAHACIAHINTHRARNLAGVHLILIASDPGDILCTHKR